MSAKILVAFATKYGSTQEVAEAIASTLTEGGSVADLRPAKDVKGLEDYGGVVLGAPLYMFRWHKDAVRFLRRHRSALEERPTAVFALGPFNDVEKDWSDVRAQLDKQLAKFPWFSPRAVKIVGGKFDPANLGGSWKLLPALKNLPASDIRDWEDIRSWAAGLPVDLGLAGDKGGAEAD